MSNGKYYVFVGTIAIGLLFLVSVLAYGQSLTGDAAIQRFIAISTAVAAVGGFLAFVILVFYTIETRLLRKAAEEQLEGTIKPVLLFEISSAERGLGAAMNLTTFHIKNIGFGPAFNVTVAPLVGKGVQLEIENIPLVESNDTKPIDWSIVQNGQRNGMSKRPSLLAHHITEGNFPAAMSVSLEFRGLSGKVYRTIHELRYDALEKRVWTEFSRME